MATRGTEQPVTVVCFTASSLNASGYRFPLICDTSSVASVKRSLMFTLSGACHLSEACRVVVGARKEPKHLVACGFTRVFSIEALCNATGLTALGNNI